MKCNNWFYIDGELERWCQENFGGTADKCEIIQDDDVPENLEGVYQVSLLGCPFECVGYFYLQESSGMTKQRGYIVKCGDTKAEERAKRNMLNRKEII